MTSAPPAVCPSLPSRAPRHSTAGHPTELCIFFSIPCFGAFPVLLSVTRALILAHLFPGSSQDIELSPAPTPLDLRTQQRQRRMRPSPPGPARSRRPTSEARWGCAGSEQDKAQAERGATQDGSVGSALRVNRRNEKKGLGHLYVGFRLPRFPPISSPGDVGGYP